MKNSLAYLLFSASLFMLSACKDSELKPDKTFFGYSYFPTDLAVFVEYNVIETTHAPLAVPVTKQYQIREIITETFTDLESKSTYKIQRYKRTTASTPWQVDSVWSTKIDNYNALRNENNKTFLKLSFPLEVGKKWNGNAFNYLKKDDCILTDLDTKRKINNFEFNKTLKVVLADDSSLVYQDRRHEIYAENVGMVYKSVKSVYYSTDQPFLGQGKIDAGIIKTQILINYGKSF